MTEAAEPPGPVLDARVLLDACVLYPVTSTDLLLTMWHVGLIRGVVASAEILDEARRNCLADNPTQAAGIQRRFDAVAAVVEGATDPTPEIDVPDIELVNSKDRHVLRAAVHYGVDVVITDDETCRQELTVWVGTGGGGPMWGALNTDAYIGAVRAAEPVRLDLAIRTMARRRQRPPTTPEELLAVLARRFPSLRDY